jgi:hypothetical protein
MMILATFAAAAPAAVVVRNKSQKYYSLAHSPLRLPGSADILVDQLTVKFSYEKIDHP